MRASASYTRGIAVGMVFTQAVAHDAGALAVGLVRGDAQFVHGVEDAALHGLQAVLHAGQGALQDDVLRSRASCESCITSSMDFCTI